jgi:ribosomal protein S18 acetylase RimI-like enzyme
MLKIIQAESESELNHIRELFKEYTDSLGFDLSFQNFEQEFAELPGKYASPQGRLLLAIDDDKIVGCVGLRKLEKNICEMKRLYIRPQFRGKKFGRTLAQKVVDEARLIGYKYMRLDTVPWMNEAIALYRSMGFNEISPYRYNPIKDTLYFELKL